MPYTSDADKAKTIRKDLKASFPGIKFWVTSKNSIKVSWIDGPTEKAVNAVIMHFEKVSYCEASGEVLSGGNTYVFTNRLFSEAALNHGLKLEAAKNRTIWSAINFDEVELDPNWDDRGFSINGKREYTVFDYNRVDLSGEVYENLASLDLTDGIPVEEVTEAVEIVEEIVEVTEQVEVSEAVQEILDIRADRYSDRKEQRVERYEGLVAKHRTLAEQSYNQSTEMSKCIPMGQPILIGHYSEKGDRNFRDRIWNKMGQSVKHSDTAKYYSGKAAAADSNDAIYGDDPEAITKVSAKIAELEANQESMKASNKIIKSTKLSDGEKVEALHQNGHSIESAKEILSPQKWRGAGYQGYELTNNSANIRRMKQRLEELERSLLAAAVKGDEEKEYPEHNMTVITARSIDRLQLIFEGKPSGDVRKILKSNGFRWAPSSTAWQRHLGNSAYALDRVLAELGKLKCLTA